MTNTPYAPPTTMLLKAEEKLCSTCNAVIHKKAEICPKCGVRQQNPANKSALLLIGIITNYLFFRRSWRTPILSW